MTAPAPAITVERTGLVTSVGQSAAASCAAMRAKLANPTETRFINNQGEWIMAHQVALDQPWRGLNKLAQMASMAISECLADLPGDEWVRIPLLLCVAERDRPGRHEDLDTLLFQEIERLLQGRFAPESSVIAHGRVSLGVALAQARRLIGEGRASRVLVAAADSLLTWPAVSAYARDERLLAPGNSNGFMLGEAGGALLLCAPDGKPGLRLKGMGFGVEKVRVDVESPFRADGLTQAIQGALAEAGYALHELDFRIADLSGEQYYFKEAALALGRILRTHKEEFDLWHPAESVGETGAAAGIGIVALADAACRKAFGPGPRILVHLGSDAGQRAAAVFEYGA